jgi:hypothetical protein
MTLLPDILALGNKTFTSASRDSIGSPRKAASGNSCKNLSAIQRSDQNVMALFSYYFSLARQDLPLNEQVFHRNNKANSLRKLL